MNQENYVIFKGTKDGVTVLFQPDVPFEELCTQLEQKVEEAGKFFDNVKTSLAFKGGRRKTASDHCRTHHHAHHIRQNGKQRTEADL